jgi:hypothetical protein
MSRASLAALHTRVGAGTELPPLPAVAYLVRAAGSIELPRHTFYQRTVSVIDLFERVAQRRRGMGLNHGGLPRPWAGAD